MALRLSIIFGVTLLLLFATSVSYPVSQNNQLLDELEFEQTEGRFLSTSYTTDTDVCVEEKKDFCMDSPPVAPGKMNWYGISAVGKPAKSSKFPQKLRIRRAQSDDDLYFKQDYSNNDHSNSCKLPGGLKTGEILCKLWPSSISCNIHCIYGHTLSEGITRKLSCNYNENRWSLDFEECKPFVNCRVQMRAPGFAKCVLNEMKNPRCDIECKIYEDKLAIKKQTYNCYANGTWEPPLPFCVELKGGITLSKIPLTNVHVALDYP